jgi:glutathione S-transferase
MQIYKGEMINEACSTDIGFKFFGSAVFTPAGEARDAKFADIKEKHFPNFCAILERHLPADAKFINGDSLTTADFTVGGWIINLILNPNAKDAAFFAELWATAPARVVKYADDLKAEMKDYLAARP